MSTSLELVTATWAGDAAQFGLLRASLAQSALAGLPHLVAVQTEDYALFEEFAGKSCQLWPTAELLPGDLDQRRYRARRWQQRCGPTLTKWLTSTARLGWPDWVRYLGWQMQQISKLTLAARSSADLVIVLDSDVIVSRHARCEDFSLARGIPCPSQPEAMAALRGKVRNWNQSALQLLALEDEALPADRYFDTPFPLHPGRLRAMMQWLEQRYQQPWWACLLAQAPRRWSEFATYRTFLFAAPDRTTHRIYRQPPDWQRYIYDASDSARLTHEATDALASPDCHYLTVHSQSSGRQAWSVADSIDQLYDVVGAHYCEEKMR